MWERGGADFGAASPTNRLSPTRFRVGLSLYQKISECHQQSLLPAGTLSSSMSKFSSSLPSTSRAAESSIPLDI